MNNKQPTLSRRAAGILLHPTSLPGRHGSGDLGLPAREFATFLHQAGQSWWQMLPIHPIGPGNSPYSALSAFAGNPLLISLERLADDGLLDRRDVAPARGLHTDRVNYPSVIRYRNSRLRRAYDAFRSAGGLRRKAFECFCATHADWLDDHALFMALRAANGGRAWLRWPRGVRLRQGRALTGARKDLADEIDLERFVQYIFDQQWTVLHEHARALGVGLIGDIPIFVAHDSSDVWARRELFDLAADGRAKTVSGVPPDCFSRTGQLWGHPQYRWSRHQQTRFAWWIARFRRALDQFDAARIDHFLGFHRVWSVSGRARIARNGRWVRTPGRALLQTLKRKLGALPIIAEDLGVVTPEALALRDDFGLPGMRLLHFAFGNDDGDRYNQPHNYPRNCVAYPGTHDNETTVGWFQRLRREHERDDAVNLSPYERVLRYIGKSGRSIHWDMIRLAQQSPANLAVIPLQDVLGLDNDARMNRPATTRGNWEWRVRRSRLSAALAEGLRDLAEAYERLPLET
jgi:4-alpha-glucanotransferase